MQFGLSESQQILKDTARKFFAGESPIAAVRKAMETDTAYDAAFWTKLAEQGFTGIITPEEYGGMGLGKGRACSADGRSRICDAAGAVLLHRGAGRSSD